MAKRNEHLVVIMLEPLKPGVEFEIWPQHITIVPWFHCDDGKKLDGILEVVAGRHAPFKARAAQTEAWGGSTKFEVIIVDEPNGQLQSLHEDIFDSLGANGFSVHQKDYLGDKYRPHVTINNKVQKHQPLLKEGQAIIIDEITLISQVRLKSTGQMIKTIKKAYPLAHYS